MTHVSGNFENFLIQKNYIFISSFSDEPIVKGCFADQSKNYQNYCSNSSASICQTCSGNNCNIDQVRRDEQCIVCNSAIDETCSQQPNKLPAQHCSTVSNGTCFERIFDGATIRGCSGNLNELEMSNCNESNNCKLTRYSNHPNDEIIPANRLKCQHCDSRIDATCADPDIKNREEILPCKRFAQPESCIKIELNGSSEFSKYF